jgi:N-acetyl-alpha-D-muramate 1-phosphate uridylyltransferase
MVDSVAGIVLAAGVGSRLRPLTRFRPKALCPVDNVPLVDLALARVAEVIGDGPANLAVNVHHHADQVVDHVGDRAHLSVEQPVALGTAGAVGHLRPWLDGRPALVVNGDTWSSISLSPLLDGWDGASVRVLVAGAASLLPGVGVVGSLLPADVVATLPSRPAGLYEVCWKPLLAEGRLDVIGEEGPFVACDRPVDYLTANLASSGGAPVIGDGAVVRGTVTRSVVWPGATVFEDEELVDAIRVDDRVTVLVR